MAHANFHVAVGVGLGTALTMPGVCLAWIRGHSLARAVGRMLVVAYGLGAWAIVPNLLGYAGITSALHSHPLGELFLLHRSIDGRSEGGLMVGELALGAMLVLHYTVIVAAVVKVSTRPPSN